MQIPKHNRASNQIFPPNLSNHRREEFQLKLTKWKKENDETDSYMFEFIKNRFEECFFGQATRHPKTGYLANVLNLTGLGLTSIPDVFEFSPPTLHTINLAGNALDNLPDSLKFATQLNTLKLAYNKFTHCPNIVTQLITIEKIDLSNNCLSTLPKEFSNLENLKEINLDGNVIQETPEALKNLFLLQAVRINQIPSAVIFADLINLPLCKVYGKCGKLDKNILLNDKM